MSVTLHISAIFFSFWKSWFFGFSVGEGVKGQKIIHNYQFQSVTLFMSRTIDHIKILVHRCKIMISWGVFLYFYKKSNIVNLKIPCIFYWPISAVFYNKSLFFKLINKCQTEILSCAHLLYMCGILFNNDRLCNKSVDVILIYLV